MGAGDNAEARSSRSIAMLTSARSKRSKVLVVPIVVQLSQIHVYPISLSSARDGLG